jgi:hypothetical protein
VVSLLCGWILLKRLPMIAAAQTALADPLPIAK